MHVLRPSRFITPPPSIKSPKCSLPTLAMLIQVHPAIIHSPSTMYQLSPSYPDSASTLRRSLYPLSCPSSPMMNIRPPSRSEKMLCKKLCCTEEYDRANISLFFLSTPLKEDNNSDCNCEDLNIFLGHTVAVSPSRSRPTRNTSTDQKHSVSPTPQPCIEYQSYQGTMRTC